MENENVQGEGSQDNVKTCPMAELVVRGGTDLGQYDPRSYRDMYSSQRRRLDNVLRDYLRPKGKMEYQGSIYESHFCVTSWLKTQKAILAGGTICSVFTDRQVNDLDFYFKDYETCLKARDFFVDVLNYKQVSMTDNAITLIRRNRNVYQTIQIITRFVSEDPAVILAKFDFTIVQGAYCFSDDKFHLGHRFLLDNTERRLVYSNQSEYPICALIRTKKYVERGYKLTNGAAVAIALAVHRLKIETYRDLKEQLLGIDTQAFEEVTKGFDETKKFVASEFIQLWSDELF